MVKVASRIIQSYKKQPFTSTCTKNSILNQNYRKKKTPVCSSAPVGRSLAEDEVSSLRVGIPAWVEFYHRDRRQGVLAFVVAVHGVPHPLRSSSSTATKTATDSSNAAATTTTAEPGDNNLSSPARATRTPAWTCLRTGIELSRSVEAYRECIGASQISDSWQSKAPPRVFQHMGNADQVGCMRRSGMCSFLDWAGGSRSRGRATVGEPAIYRTFFCRGTRLVFSVFAVVCHL